MSAPSLLRAMAEAQHGGRARAGAPWTGEEDAQLLAAFYSLPRPRPAALADMMQRTPGAVVTRLVRLGHLIETNQGYFLPALYCAFKDLKEPQ